MDWSILQGMLSGSFVDLWKPVVFLMVLVVGYMYLRAAKQGSARAVTSGQKVSFLIGLALFYAAVGSPLDYVGHHYLFSVHMFNQSMLYLIMPLFILRGMPGWMVEGTLRALRLERIAQLAIRPIIAIFSFNMLFSLYHVPMVMDAVMANEWLQFGYHAVLLVSAFAMWFPVIGHVESWERMSELKRMGYIFLNGILLTPACALIIFAGKPIYEMYQGVAMPIAGYTVVEDQQLGGVVMKIIQEITYGTALALTFFRWFRTERKRDEQDELDHPEQMQHEYAAPEFNGV